MLHAQSHRHKRNPAVGGPDAGLGLSAQCCTTMGVSPFPSRAKSRFSSENITWLMFKGRHPYKKLELTHREKKNPTETSSLFCASYVEQGKEPVREAC